MTEIELSRQSIDALSRVIVEKLLQAEDGALKAILQDQLSEIRKKRANEERERERAARMERLNKSDLPTAADRKAEVILRKQQEVTICPHPDCGARNSAEAVTCRICGTAVRREEEVAHVKI